MQGQINALLLNQIVLLKDMRKFFVPDYKPDPVLTEVSSMLFLYFDVEGSRTGPAVRVIDFHQLVSSEQQIRQADCCTASLTDSVTKRASPSLSHFPPPTFIKQLLFIKAVSLLLCLL